MRVLLLCVCTTAWMLSVHAADGRRSGHRHREAGRRGPGPETGRPGEEEARGPAGLPQSEPPRKGRWGACAALAARMRTTACTKERCPPRCRGSSRCPKGLCSVSKATGSPVNHHARPASFSPNPSSELERSGASAKLATGPKQMAFRPAPENPPDSTRRPLTEELLQGNSSVSSSPQESPEASDASSSSPNSSPESEDFSPSFKLSSGTKLKAVAAKKTFLSLREAQAVLMKKMAGGKRDKLATALMKHIEKEKKRLSVGTSFSHQGNVTLHIDAPAVVCRLLCKNGGVCLLKDRCLCPSNFTGKFCQIPITSQAMPSFTSPNEIVKPPRVSVAAPSTDLTRSEFLLPLRGQNQDLPGGAAGASLVKVRVQHPPEASVKVHQVMKVSGFMPAPQPLLSGALSGSAGAPAPVDSGVRSQTLGGEGVYAQHIGFKYCFREVKDGQCSSPLPGLRSKEMCCRGLGKAWGSSDCTLCPPHKGRNNSTCPVGFQPSNGTKCLDVDECLQPGLCENGLCVNTAGSYSCVCDPGYILDASHGLCISQSVISEEKGQCHRVLGSGLGPSSCSLPILRNITKQICCCSRVGKAWGPECQRCPYFGSAAFKEICPAGPGYHYSASVLQFSQRAADQLGTRGAQLVTNGDQRHHGTAFRGAGKSQQKPSSGRPSPPPPRLAVSPPPSRPAKPGSAAWHRPQTPDGAATQPTRPKPTAAPVRWPPRSNESQDTGRDQGTAGSQGTSQNQVTYRSQGTRQNQGIGRNRGSSQNHNTSGSQGSSQILDRSWDQRTDGSQDTTKNQVTGHKQGTSRSQIPNRSQGTRLGQGISISQNAKEATKQSPGSGRSPVTDRNQVASDNRGTDGSQETSGGPSSTWNRGTSASQGLLPGRGDSLPEPAPRIPQQDSGPRGDLLKPQTTTRPPHVKPRGACESKPDACGGGRCVDQPGGKHSCVCHQGYKANAQRTHCQDVNECVASRGVCAPGECVNNAGSYRCVCPPGYKTDARKTSCQDVNECEDPLLCPGQECKNNPGSYRCVSCQPGFGLLNGLCTDIDECVQAPCTNGGCENTPGSFRCLCRHGYKLTNNTCADIDECADVSQCPGQICVNSVGSYRCVSCRPGYTLTNKQCTDVNECEDSSLCPGGQCVNTKGSYKCVDCRQGYRATNGVCEDVDECLSESACETERVCVNTVGSFRCNCLPGYRTFGRGRPCRDIDECLEENWCPPTGECVNTPGSFKCVCPQGYALDEGHDGNNRTCVDVNECARADVCADGECVNTEGSFACRCRRGFVSNPESNACLDADECASSGGSVCGESERCENTIGSYRCLTSCEPGFRASADGRCHDVDECADGSACGRHAVCQNVAGTYVCVCDPGFTAAPDGNSCEDEDECASMPGVCGSARCDNLEGSFMCECDTPGEHFHAAARRCVSPLPPEAFDLRPSSSSPSSSFHAGAFELPAPRPGELRECYYDVGSSSCSLLAANTSRQECCCTLGEGWGLGCRYLACPPANSADFLSLCPSGRGYVTSGEADFSYTDVDECKRFHPQVCKNGVCVNNIPGYNCYCSSGFVYSVALLECVDLDECEQESCEGGSCVNTLGSYYCSCSPPLVLDDTQRKCVNASHLTPDENLSVCWQTVSAELMCQSPLLGAQVTFSDCCCLYGQGWGMECALCPQTDSDDFGSLCSSFPAVVFPDPEALGPGRGGGPPFFPPFSSDAFPPDALAATDYDDYTAGGGGGSFFPGGAPPADAYPGPRHFDEAYYPGRPYEDSPAFGVGRQSPPSPGESPLNLAPLPQGSPFDEDLEGDSWGPGPPPPPRRLYERRYDAYAGLSAADDCGIVDGCRNGTCIRLDEGYTCDCYHGYRLDATTMTCIDVNECLGGVDVDFPCINSRCVNTDGSFRCVCRRGYVMSRRLNHCVPA